MSKMIKLENKHSCVEIAPDGELSFSLEGESSWKASTLAVLHYYDRQHPRADSLDVPSGSAREFGTAGTLSLSAKSSLDVTQVDKQTAEVRLLFDALSISITLDIKLDETGFRVNISDENISEQESDLFRILSLEVLPEFGAAKTGEDGYLTLPNWFGCRTYFNKKYPREVRQTIYSSNDQWENNCNAPVFGITREHGTLCGLIAQGDEDAQLVCRQHWEEAEANSAHPQLMYRWVQEDEIIIGDREVRYSFAAADCPQGEGYAFVAMQYRDYLRNDRGIQTWAEKAKTRPEALDYSERFFLKIFMGYKEPHPEGKGQYHCTTSCDEAREIIQECLDRGMKKLAVMLVGWGQDGHDGQPPRYFPVDERVGGEDKMRELIEWAKENDVMLGVHTCFVDIYECSPEFDLDDVIRHRSGGAWAGVIWSGGRAYRPCPQAVHKYVERDIKRLSETGFHGHHHFDAVGGFKLCYSDKHPLKTRSAFIEAVRENCREAIKNLGSVSTEMPFGQYFDVMDGFHHSHSHPGNHLRGCTMARYFLDDIVPLLGIALHGSHNCGESIAHKTPAGDKRMAELQSLYLAPSYEVCTRPSPEFGIPPYKGKEAMMADAYAYAFGPEGYMTKFNQLDIEGRWELANGDIKTLYSDGSEVTVNLNVAGASKVAGASSSGKNVLGASCSGMDVAGASCSEKNVPGASCSGMDVVAPDWTTLAVRQGESLPHWSCESAIYHVSFRLADSVPSGVRDAWIRERNSIVATAEQLGRALSEDEEKRLQYLYSDKIEKYLDAGHGACHMKNPPIADLIANALCHFDGQRYRLHAWCVMPNHVHAIVEPLAGQQLEKIVHSWKSFTANKVNEILKLTGQLWQHEPYDHIIRTEKEYRFQLNYVWDNPEKAGLGHWQWRYRR